jgi:DNA-binding MurR/RpiR family transcriptional regulator
VHFIEGQCHLCFSFRGATSETAHAAAHTAKQGFKEVAETASRIIFMRRLPAPAAG